MTSPAFNPTLPSDVEAALAQGRKFEAFELLKSHLFEASKALSAQDESGSALINDDEIVARHGSVVCEAARALDQGDHDRVVRGLRQAIEMRLGPPERARAGQALSPGQVPRATWVPYAVTVAIVLALAAVFHFQRMP